MLNVVLAYSIRWHLGTFSVGQWQQFRKQRKHEICSANVNRITFALIGCMQKLQAVPERSKNAECNTMAVTDTTTALTQIHRVVIQIQP